MMRDIQKRDADDPTVTEPDDRYVRSRVEDRSTWVKVSYILDKYRPLVYLAGAILLSLGYGFHTPQSQFDEIKGTVKQQTEFLQHQIDSLKAAQAVAVAQQRDQVMMQRFSTRVICSTLTAERKYEMGGEDLCADAAHLTK